MVSATLNASIITWLRSFDAAARNASFTRAGAELNLTQGAVSQQVRQLEAAIGCPLFLREVGALRLTPKGHELSYAIAESFEGLRKALQQFGGNGKSQQIRLHCTPSFAFAWLSPRLGKSHQLHQGIDIQLNADHHVDLLAGHDVSHGTLFINYRPISKAKDVTSPLLEEYLIPVANPRDKEFSGSQYIDLHKACLLHDTEPWSGAGKFQEWNEWFSATSLPIPSYERSRSFNLSQLAMGAALDGSGVALGRLSHVIEHLRSGRLAIAYPYAVRSSALYDLGGDMVSGRAIAFSNWLRKEADDFSAERDAFLTDRNITVVSVAR